MPRPVLLSQATEPLREEATDEIDATANAAHLAGFEVVHMPLSLDEASADARFAELPVAAPPRPAVLSGVIHPPSLYAHLHARAAERGLVFVNGPDQYAELFEFARWYARVADLTPASVVFPTDAPVDAIVAGAVADLRLPIFVKGSLQSLKHRGWKACVATTEAELRANVEAIVASAFHSRGHVVLRELAPLVRAEVAALPIPMGREFRVFLHEGEVLGHGFYWSLFHEMAFLDDAEERAMLEVAREVAARLSAPFVSVDVAQREDGRWILLEVGDPQCSGFGLMPVKQVWRRLYERLASS